MDITGFVNTFISLMVEGVTKCFSILDSISFMGVTLLQYCLWIMILSALIPIVFSIVRTQSSRLESRSSVNNGREKGKMLGEADATK